MNTFINTMSNMTYTENGAVTYKSSGSGVVDFFFHGAALRKDGGDRTIELFKSAFDEDKTLALRELFYIRDVRGGQGERDTFRKIIFWLSENEPKWLNSHLHLVPEYGRWDDLLTLLECPESIDAVTNYLASTYKEDLIKLVNGKEHELTLIGKWLPSENASSKYTKINARNLIASGLFGTPKEYRKNLSALRSALKVVEKNLCSGEYDKIDYSKLPSLAAIKYRKAFNRNDGERYSIYLSRVDKDEAKINAGTLYPYDVIRMINGTYGNLSCLRDDRTAEIAWKALPDYVPAFNGLVVYDTSGSMDGFPILVSTSLAMYIGERNKSEVWKNYVIPFSSRAEFKKITGNTLVEKYKSIYTGDYSNTNLQSVFDLILVRAVRENVKKEDMPSVLIIISDMEFGGNHGYTNFKTIKKRYAEYNYEMPNIVWWNVDSRNTQTPVKVNDKGVSLVSGSSPSALMAALGGGYSPMDTVLRVINSDRYINIKY